MSAIIQIGLIFISTYLFIQKSITFGTLILVITYLSMMMETLWDITHQIRRFMRDSGNAEEGLKILGHEPVIKDSPNSSALSILKPTIDISSITFQYAGASSKVFENFSLSIHPGEKIALVGPSGSGKSTITKLLFRIYDIQG
jgi:ATP-binding cassette subfamily B protein